MTGRRWTGLAQAAVIVAAGAIAALLVLGGHPRTTNAVTYQTTPVQVTTVTDQITASGTVAAQLTLALSFGASTIPVTSVRVGVGAHVRAGQVLATVDSAAAEQQLAVAQAQLAAATVAATATAAPVAAAAAPVAVAAVGGTAAQRSATGGRGSAGGRPARTIAPTCPPASAPIPPSGRPPIGPTPSQPTHADSVTPSPTAPTATGAPPVIATPTDVSAPGAGVPGGTATAAAAARSRSLAPTPVDTTTSAPTTASHAPVGSPSRTSPPAVPTSSAPALPGSSSPLGPQPSACATTAGPTAAQSSGSAAVSRPPSGTGGRVAAGSGSTGGGAAAGASGGGGAAGSITSAQQQVNDAETAVAATRLVAPQDGVIVSENLLRGVLPGTPAITMRADGYHVVVEVAEQDAPYIRLGQQGQVTFPALSTTTAATVVQEPMAASASAGGSPVVSFPVVFAVSAPPPGLLPGMSASLTLGVSSQSNVLAVPTTSIQSADAGYVVRVLVAGQPETRPVRLGLSTSSLTQIVAGLAEGDQVITGTTT